MHLTLSQQLYHIDIRIKRHRDFCRGKDTQSHSTYPSGTELHAWMCPVSHTVMDTHSDGHTQPVSLMLITAHLQLKSRTMRE